MYEPSTLDVLHRISNYSLEAAYQSLSALFVIKCLTLSMPLRLVRSPQH